MNTHVVLCKDCPWLVRAYQYRAKSSEVLFCSEPEHCGLGYKYETKRCRAPGSKKEGDIIVSLNCRSRLARFTQRVVPIATFVGWMRLIKHKTEYVFNVNYLVGENALREYTMGSHV